MRRILCYGDSNTWGYIAGTGQRYDHNERWTGVLQRELGKDYTVIEEGLPGRTSVYDNPCALGRKGSDYLLPCLISQKPLDLVVLMLGTNDLHWTDAYGSAEGARQLIKLIKIYSHLEESSWIFSGGKGSARILLVAPIHVDQSAYKSNPVACRHQYATESLRFAELFQTVAQETGCDYLNSALYAEPDIVDGIHMTRYSHERLGVAIASKIKECLSKRRLIS